mmetsp:Transcript_13527/g.16566  ORF Transcript_13527/g.16566 Transcript_13527/m.16566 type:complete len:395 (+) Transcript_13527:295-1479(+)
MITQLITTASAPSTESGPYVPLIFPGMIAPTHASAAPAAGGPSSGGSGTPHGAPGGVDGSGGLPLSRGGGGGGGGLPPGRGGSAPDFSLTPGTLNMHLVINYAKFSDIKVWMEATSVVSLLFSADAQEVNTYTKKLQERAIKYGWGHPLANILTIPDANGINKSLLTDYGQLTTKDIRNHSVTYVANNSRQAQNNMQFYHCQLVSMTESAQIKTLTKSDTYHIYGTPSGALLFKLLMQKAIVDTRATATMFRDDLSSLDAYASSVNSDIASINQCVKLNYKGIKARGERCDDIMSNLFKGYLCITDKDFVSYIKLKKNEYDDGADLSPERLMQLALNKYKILTTKEMWGAPSSKEVQITALSAQVQGLKDSNLRTLSFRSISETHGTGMWCGHP